LRLGKVLDPNDWDARQLKKLCGLPAADAGDDPHVRIDNYRVEEPEVVDAPGNPLDVLSRHLPKLTRRGLQDSRCHRLDADLDGGNVAATGQKC